MGNYLISNLASDNKVKHKNNAGQNKNLNQKTTSLSLKIERRHKFRNI